jgi:PAS domain S-box-containing protein
MKGRIVVVEDDDLILHLIRIILERREYAVVGWAATGEEAMARIVETAPDVVLMDIRLKGHMDGIDAATYVRSILDIPVVFITASGDKATLDRAKQARPYGFITKPFNDREITSAVEFALHQHVPLNIGQYGRQRRDWGIPAVTITDREGRIFYLNHAGKDLFGIDPEKALSRPFQEIIRLRDPVTDTEVRDLLTPTTNGGLIRRELSLLRQDNTEQYVAVETGALETAAGERKGAICIMHPL